MLATSHVEEIESLFLAGDHAAALALSAELSHYTGADELIRAAAILSTHGQNPGSADLLADAVRLRPDDSNLAIDLAQRLWMAGRTDAAVATMRQSLARWPQAPGLYRMLGMMQLTGGRYLDALMAYATAHSLDPKDGTALIGRACAFRLLSNQRTVPVRLGPLEARFAVSGRSLSVDFVHLSGEFYEAAELLALDDLLAPSGVVVDVGANLGNHAVYLLHAVQPKELVLFEPNPACVTVLRENLALNVTPSTRVVLHEEGVGREPGEFFFNEHDDLNNGLVPVAQGTARAVKIVTLDERVPHADVLKIDVEGMEIDVLAGARRLLRESRPVLFVEVQTRNREAFAALLAEFGYVEHRTFAYADYTNVVARPA